MDLMLNITVPKPPEPITHRDRIMSVGSCFTEHIGNALKDLKFTVLQNPNGILFDPASVCDSLLSYIDNRTYGEGDLFLLHELWHSWQHHSRFSGMDKAGVLESMNRAQADAHSFLKEADWLIITLGSSFSYRLTTEAPQTSTAGIGAGVANCHRAPANWFRKHLMTIDETVSSLDTVIHRLARFNPKMRILFTISPVRHIRDGVVENNRSKARLLEAVHHLVGKFDRLHYFPSYEIVIDVLRDYRFYAEDLVHPNYLATGFVLDKFVESYVAPESQALVAELKKLQVAVSHKPSHPGTEAHRKFRERQLSNVLALQEAYGFLDLSAERAHFSGTS
ncbi:MAG: hypothetical protein JWP27_2121 [Flaviaesturariibacter sp.]|nr:hypothetical protein [Flaviaesturariibacter sp.]